MTDGIRFEATIHIGGDSHECVTNNPKAMAAFLSAIAETCGVYAAMLIIPDTDPPLEGGAWLREAPKSQIRYCDGVADCPDFWGCVAARACTKTRANPFPAGPATYSTFPVDAPEAPKPPLEIKMVTVREGKGAGWAILVVVLLSFGLWAVLTGC